MSDGEKCQRCGDVGEDRRTLFMSCSYEMSELRVPFKMRQIVGVSTAEVGEKKSRYMTLHEFADPAADAKPWPHNFYTLRVCKDCRGSWMSAIASWFADKPARESCGSGIFVRENGATVEVTEDEWRRRHGDREPVRVLP